MNRFKNILCVLGPVDSSHDVLARAVTLAKNNQATLTVIDVIPHITIGIGMPMGGPTLPNIQEEITNSYTHRLEELIAPYRKQISITSKVLIGTPFLSIIREVLRQQHDLLIKIPDQQDWLSRFFGSDDMQLLRKCPCPVWLIKPESPKSYHTILAAVDASEIDYSPDLETSKSLNQHIIQIASSLAISEFSELHVAHAWNAMGEHAMHYGIFTRTPEAEINDYVETVKQQHRESLNTLLYDVMNTQNNEALEYLKPQSHLVKGLARREIPKLAEEIKADLVVMGTVGRIGIPGFIMGNTAETILNNINCSVLAIKPEGFVTPVTLEE
jgi:nucleotide-binding universal stress UspA family protein